MSKYDGRVLEVTVSLGQRVRLGQRLGSVMAEDPNKPLMALTYFDVQDGKRIKQGLVIRITPATVRRERYGSMLGIVESVSPYPVTRDAVASQVGNLEVAASLAGNAPQIEVVAQLTRDPQTISKYAWTSGAGPDLDLTAGTTASARVTIERIAPKDFVLPMLRSWTGVDTR